MSLVRSDFDNPNVANAINPSAFGYHHGKYTGTSMRSLRATNTFRKTHTEYTLYAGPIPNHNGGWIPARQLAARAAGVRRKYQVSIVKGGMRSIY